MRVLTGQTALEAWEKGQRLDLVGRALALLAAASPEVGPEELANLSVGQRDALLIRLREKTFGNVQKCFVRCVKCGAPLEFGLDLRTLDADKELQSLKPQTTWTTVEDYQVCFRLPNSYDLKVVAEYCLDVGSAAQMLLERCVLEVRRGSETLRGRDLPPEIVEKVAAQMEEVDPLGDIPLAIDCGRCGQHIEVVLDLANMLWQEVEGAAQRLLHEVHTLASAYGWTEDEILALSASRRRSYITQVKPKK